MIETVRRSLLYILLTVIWLILLAFCALIGVFIVPISVDSTSYLVIFVVSTIKVLASMLLVAIWLIGWYKSLQVLFNFEVNASRSKTNI